MRKVLYLFGQLRDEDIDWMARIGTLSVLREGAVLIEQGTPVDWLFIVLDGTLSVRVRGIGEVARLASGEVVGEMSFVSAALPSASVSSLGDSKVLALNKRMLEERFERDPGFASRFYKALAMFLAERLRGTVQRLGYGENKGPATAAEQADNEIDDALLDKVSLAGVRFERMVDMLARQ